MIDLATHGAVRAHETRRVDAVGARRPHGVQVGLLLPGGDLLAPVHDWFAEGFDTADPKDAKALLEELN